jgi:putative membrane protein
MKKVIIVNDKIKINKFLDWLIHMVGYTLVLILISMMFKSIYIDNSYFGLWALLASVIIYILNKTIKPIIFILTLPITGLTLGIFYPFINVIIIKMADFILGNHFQTHSLFALFFAAILISIMNFFMDKIVMDPITRKKVNR